MNETLYLTLFMAIYTVLIITGTGMYSGSVLYATTYDNENRIRSDASRKGKMVDAILKLLWMGIILIPINYYLIKDLIMAIRSL